MGAIGPIEIAVVMAILFLFFGAKRLPKIARGIGESIREIRKIGDGIE